MGSRRIRHNLATEQQHAGIKKGFLSLSAQGQMAHMLKYCRAELEDSYYLTWRMRKPTLKEVKRDTWQDLACALTVGKTC